MIETWKVQDLIMKIKQGLCLGSELLPEERQGKCSNCTTLEGVIAEWSVEAAGPYKYKVRSSADIESCKVCRFEYGSIECLPCNHYET